MASRRGQPQTSQALRAALRVYAQIFKRKQRLVTVIYKHLQLEVIRTDEPPIEDRDTKGHMLIFIDRADFAACSTLNHYQFNQQVGTIYIRDGNFLLRRVNLSLCAEHFQNNGVVTGLVVRVRRGRYILRRITSPQRPKIRLPILGFVGKCDLQRDLAARRIGEESCHRTGLRHIYRDFNGIALHHVLVNRYENKSVLSSRVRSKTRRDAGRI